MIVFTYDMVNLLNRYWSGLISTRCGCSCSKLNRAIMQREDRDLVVKQKGGVDDFI